MSHTGSYAGDLDPTETWARLKRDPKARLIDVRSEAEWTFVGLPDLSGLAKQPLLLAWQHFPGMRMNPEFVEQLSAELSDKDGPLFFLCRSGQRSMHAAAALTAVGYRQCYNVVEGFEGRHDAEGHRGTIAGWKARGLPWRQG
ncbi:MAG: rhodanese-like domain-containing protein [Rhodospirillales bacterium]|nr:rhodanese-like domain-containing protein [Rhodospirillales bacterium]